MWKFGKEKLKEAEKKLNKISAEDVKNGTKKVAKEVVEEGVEVVKTGIFATINGIIIKLVMGVALIVLITAGGCVGTNVAIDKLTTKNVEETKIIK